MNCPTCGKPTEWNDNAARPFCSERCKLIDFGRWANEEFRVPEARSEAHVDNDSPSRPPKPDDEPASE